MSSEMLSSGMVRLTDPHLLFAVSLINMADPDNSANGMRIADDLMEASVLTDHSEIPVGIQKLTELLADPNVSSGDMKGLLNRASAKTWGIEYDRAFTPRDFLEALKSALEDYVRRRAGH